MTISNQLLRQTNLIYEGKIDKVLYKIKDPVCNNAYNRILLVAKEAFGGRMDYVNWYFDNCLPILDGLGNVLNGVEVRGSCVRGNFKHSEVIVTALTVETEILAKAILLYFNSPEEIEKYVLSEETSPSINYVKKMRPEDFKKIKNALKKIKKGEGIEFTGGYFLREIEVVKEYYSLGIPGIQNYNVTSLSSLYDLRRAFQKIEDDYRKEQERIISLKERPVRKNKPLLICSDPNFEWYDVGKKGCELEKRSLNTCASNPDSDTIWALREKSFGKDGGLVGYVTRIHIGYNKSEGALKEIKGYSNNKPSPKYFPMFADLAKSGLFKCIDISGSYNPENDLSWNDLSDEMLDDIVEENPKLLEYDEYLAEMFGADSLSTKNERLLSCCTLKDVEGVTKALEDGADVNCYSGLPLDEAIRPGNSNVVRVLLQHGAKADMWDSRPLEKAVSIGDVRIAKMLIEHGAQISQVRKILVIPSYRGHVGMVKFLLDAGVDPNMEKGLPLKHAKKQGYDEIVNLLLAAGADPKLLEGQ